MKKRTKINNIKVKLLSGMIILSVLPLLILGIGSYNQSKEKLEDKLKLTSMQML
jgi:methyl-accepting chemotaxis protein